MANAPDSAPVLWDQDLLNEGAPGDITWVDMKVLASIGP
jgi:hypothetical protein